MKALRFHGHKDIRLDEVDEPTPQPGWSVLAVDWASICRSDIKEFLGPLYIDPDRPNPITGVSVPVTLGHEFAGRVVDTDGSRADIAVGDRVTVDGCVKDGTCWFCQQGNYVLCDNLAILGFDAHGGFAELVAAPNYALHKLPETISDEAAAVIEPLAVVTHAVRRARVEPGATVAVVGAGMIGLGAVALSRTVGAGMVHVIEPVAQRRDRAIGLGATSVIDPSDGDPVDQLGNRTSGRGADVVFDCVGTEASLNSAITLARKGGRVAVIGVFRAPATVDMNQVVLQEREIVGNLAYVDDFPRVISLMGDGRVNGEDFVTARIALRDIIEQGFEVLLDRPEDHVRIIVDAHAV
jgi:(R,R)-butanediol dehydrogenase/meso-butanediol dehydrogenase/diacetyl reductase